MYRLFKRVQQFDIENVLRTTADKIVGCSRQASRFGATERE
ncbi:hypothetical protein PI172_2050 [Prevotella intermedia]|uniref:Uncharacterized protein n=1 Tax=Prevotella intermedia TaxID=28131 RepID=A0AAD1BK48_PREIN|nr:hypothetical protein PI172_2050 [Prevotella intermedia]